VACLPQASAEPDGSSGNSRFRKHESHHITTIDKEPRKGWREHKWNVRFGAFGFTVLQRLDPKTGFPPRKRTWGDSFFGVVGHKEKAYFSANWSPWTFLEPQIRLAGSPDEVLPPPTLYGRCVFAGIRECTPNRIVAEAIFRDTAGGWTRIRFIGLADTLDRFGVTVNYAPPNEKTVTSLTYRLICQPHDYSDRGYWQRRRTVTTPSGNTAMPDAAEHHYSSTDGPWLFHNRFAHLTSGTFLDRNLTNIAGLTIRGIGKTIAIDLTPRNRHAWTGFVCGDWVAENWQLRSHRLLHEDPAITKGQADRLFAPPTAPTDCGAEFAGTAADKSPDVTKALISCQAALRTLQAADSAQNLAEFAATKDVLREAVRTQRTTWLTTKQWRSAE